MLRASSIFCTVVATAASSLAGPAACAAGIGGTAVAGAPARVVSNVSQTTTASMLATLGVRITLCSGVVETPAFVAASATSVVATGTTCVIKATIVNATTTRFDVIHTGGSDGVMTVELGNAASQVGFDRAQLKPGTVGSSTGAEFAMSSVLSTGSWTAYPSYRDPVTLAGADAAGDLFDELQVRFSSRFAAGDRLVFNVDTDSMR